MLSSWNMKSAALSDRLSKVSAAINDFKASLGIAGPSPRVEIEDVKGPPEVRVQTRIRRMTDIVVDLRERFKGLKRGREEEERNGKENTAEAEEVPVISSKSFHGYYSCQYGTVPLAGKQTH